MSFQVLLGGASTRWMQLRLWLLLADGMLLPFEKLDDYASVASWLEDGAPEESSSREEVELMVETVYSTRADAVAQLNNVDLPAGYIPQPGAIPLLGSVVLAADHVLYRYSWTSTDPRFQNGNLLPGTYFTSALDQFLTNTGFGAVGRYALPIPAPAVHLFQYHLPAGTRLKVGTVAPMFGQAGGGVEVQLDGSGPCAANQIGRLVISAW